MVSPSISTGLPTHPGLVKVVRNSGHYASYAVSEVSLPAGALFAKIESTTLAPDATYATVQVGAGKHINLNSDLVYINHSCSPNVEFDMAKMEVRVARNKKNGIKKGDKLSFFYPSTEWSMAQPFKCHCGESCCLGWISGSGQMDGRRLHGYWLNDHIEKMLADRAKAPRAQL